MWEAHSSNQVIKCLISHFCSTSLLLGLEARGWAVVSTYASFAVTRKNQNPKVTVNLPQAVMLLPGSTGCVLRLWRHSTCPKWTVTCTAVRGKEVPWNHDSLAKSKPWACSMPTAPEALGVLAEVSKPFQQEVSKHSFVKSCYQITREHH